LPVGRRIRASDKKHRKNSSDDGQNKKKKLCSHAEKEHLGKIWAFYLKIVHAPTDGPKGQGTSSAIRKGEGICRKTKGEQMLEKKFFFLQSTSPTTRLLGVPAVQLKKPRGG